MRKPSKATRELNKFAIWLLNDKQLQLAKRIANISQHNSEPLNNYNAKALVRYYLITTKKQKL